MVFLPKKTKLNVYRGATFMGYNRKREYCSQKNRVRCLHLKFLAYQG